MERSSSTVLSSVVEPCAEWEACAYTGRSCSPREGHVAGVVANVLYVFGGIEAGIRVNTTFAFDFGAVPAACCGEPWLRSRGAPAALRGAHAPLPPLCAPLCCPLPRPCLACVAAGTRCWTTVAQSGDVPSGRCCT
jgi:hypothetical protein